MSIQWMDAAFATALAPPRKLLMVALGNYANEIGQCWPSQETLAEDTSISVRSLRDQLHALEAAGWLRVMTLGDGRGNRTQYALNTEWLLAAKAANDARKAAARVTKGGNPRTQRRNGVADDPSGDPARDPPMEPIAASAPIRAKKVRPLTDEDVAALSAVYGTMAVQESIAYWTNTRTWQVQLDKVAFLKGRLEQRRQGNGNNGTGDGGNQRRSGTLERWREAGRVVSSE